VDANRRIIQILPKLPRELSFHKIPICANPLLAVRYLALNLRVNKDDAMAPDIRPACRYPPRSVRRCS